MKKAAFILCFMLCQYAAVGQKSVEVGIMLGGSNYSGELADKQFQNFRFAGGILGRFNLNDYITLKGNVFYGTIAGADSLSSDAGRKARNLSFYSPLFEFGGQVEWNLFGYNPIAKKGKRFSPYLFAGVAVYKYNPQGYLDDEWVELQPIATEGQGTTQFQERKKYNLTQVSIPFGAGFKVRIADKWTLGYEFGLRYTFNDYLDDVSMTYVNPLILSANYGTNSNSVRLADRSSAEVKSQREYNPLTNVGPARGNPNTNDWYTYTGVTLTYTIFGNRVKCFSF